MAYAPRTIKKGNLECINRHNCFKYTLKRLAGGDVSVQKGRNKLYTPEASYLYASEVHKKHEIDVVHPQQANIHNPAAILLDILNIKYILKIT